MQILSSRKKIQQPFFVILIYLHQLITKINSIFYLHWSINLNRTIYEKPQLNVFKSKIFGEISRNSKSNLLGKNLWRLLNHADLCY